MSDLKLEFIGKENSNFFHLYKEKKFNECFLVTQNMIVNNQHIGINVLNILIDLTNNSDELDKVLDLFSINLLYNGENLSESTISILIKKYCNFSKDIFPILSDKIEILLCLLKDKKFMLKNRMFSPIISLYHNKDLESDIINIYKYCFLNNVKLEGIDYCKIIDILLKNKSKNMELLYSLIFDFSNRIRVIDNGSIDILKKYAIKTTIDVEGLCNKNFCTLKQIEFDLQGRNNILNFMFGSKNKGNIIENFKYFIENKDYDIIIDGANVGFYKQRPDLGGKINYYQIDKVFNYFSSKGKKVLIVLHQRHNKSNNKTKKIIDKWNSSNSIYYTPRGMNDDVFWIYATLYKKDCSVVTNDKVRDHKFIINGLQKNKLNLSEFEIWFDSHNVTYDFDKELKIFDTNNYSTKIQIVENNFYLPVSKREGVEWYYISL